MARARRTKQNLFREAVNELKKMTAFGESKYQAKKEDKMDDKIFSFSTYKAYKTNALRGLKWIQEKHPEVKTLAQARPYVSDYLRSLYDGGKSAWTIGAYTMAFNKLYRCKTKDWGITLPERKREDIVRGRVESERSRFSYERNRGLVDFCRSTGLRRYELEHIKGNQLIEKDGKFYIHITNNQGKGGLERLTEVIGTYAEIKNVIDRMEKAGSGLVWGRVSSHAPIHKLRAEYAQRLYEQVARPLDTLKSSEKYYCRNERKGQHLDKQAVEIVTRNLGHSRLGVAVSNYL